jgi:polysaccharide deacetylase 2 family uncharacterized protein YibQ
LLALLAGLILIASAGGAAWLHKTHELEDLAEQPPVIVVQIPEQAVMPAETANQAAEPAGEQTASAVSTATNEAPAAAETPTTTTTTTETAPTAATEAAPTAPSGETAATAGTGIGESGSTAPATTQPTTEPATTEPAATETTTAPAETTTTAMTAGTTTESQTASADIASSTAPAPTTEIAPATETPTVPTTTAEPPAAATSPTASAVATPPAPATTMAEPEAPAGAAVATPVIPLPRLKPPPPAAPAPTMSAAVETTTSTTAAPETTTEVTPPAPASTPPAASLGAAATAEAVTAPATTQTAVATPPAATSGEPPWKKYARPFPADDPRPRVSLVVTGLGLTATQTQAAIDQLPPEITLAFSPYSGELQDWVTKARAAGHEVLIELPMEPLNYPADDPGPQALLASLSPAENLKRLEWVLARSDAVAGLVANMGSRFQASARLIRPVLTRLAEKGYLYVDNRSGPTSVVGEVAANIGLPWTYNTRFIDAEATRVSIDGRLQQLERTAREKGFALGLAQSYPVTIERVAAWARSLEVKGLALAPASALAKTGAQ